MGHIQRSEFKPHPSGLSSLFFAFATVGESRKHGKAPRSIRWLTHVSFAHSHSRMFLYRRQGGLTGDCLRVPIEVLMGFESQDWWINNTSSVSLAPTSQLSFKAD